MLTNLETQFAAMMCTILCNACMEVNLGTCTIEIGVEKLQDTKHIKSHLKTCLPAYTKIYSQNYCKT